MTDDELVQAFERLTLPADAFRHVDHVRLAFVYLRRHGLIGAISRYTDGLRTFAAHHGAAERYHETVTWASVVLVHERMAERPDLDEWTAFARENPDLLRWHDGAFFDYYPAAVLDSDLARRTFVLPR